MFVKKIITKGIASGVGLVAEAHEERKERKSRSPSPNPQARSTSPNPLSTTASQEKRYLEKKQSKDSKGSISSSEDEDEIEWDLDEAAAAIEGPPRYDDIDKDEPVDPESYAQRFIQMHDLSNSPASFEYKPLPCPVILPQRRPKNKERGFVRAYAPLLGECSNIDEKMFIDFLEDFDKSSKASPVFDVINLACFAVGFVPNPIAMAVSTAVQVANRTAQEMQQRYRLNTYLDKINETLFKPRGLYCMIMTYQPDAGAVVKMDVSSTDQALAKYMSEQDSELKEKLSKLRLTSGKTTGEVSLPEAAPLTYPALDYLATMDPNGKEISTLKQQSAFMQSYLDRRAQAIYAQPNADSKLAVPEQQRQFKSKYADPNHPIHSGTLIGLLSGGRFDPVAEKRARRARQRAVQQGITLTDEEIQAVKLGRKLDKNRGGRRGGPLSLVLTPVRKAMKKNVLYLTIVNLPSESEMMEIKQELERMKSNQSNQSWGSKLSSTMSGDSGRGKDIGKSGETISMGMR